MERADWFANQAPFNYFNMVSFNNGEAVRKSEDACILFRFYEIEEGETTKEVSKYMMTVVIDEAEYVSREKSSDDNDGKGSEQIAKETNEEIYER